MREISIIAFLFIAAIGVVGLLLVARDPAKLMEFGVEAPGSGSNLAALPNELAMPSEDEVLNKEPVAGGLTAFQPVVFEEPSRGLQVFGSIPYWDQERAFESFRNNVEAIDFVSLFWYYLTADGKIAKYEYAKEDQRILDFAKAHNVKVLALVSNLPEGEGLDWDWKRVDGVIADPEQRARHIGDIVVLVEQKGFDGINIDYEDLQDTQTDDFSLFMKELGSALHEQGKILKVALHPRENNDHTHGQDWVAISQSADQLTFMTYDEHSQSGEPGPVASINWVRRTIEFALSLGVPKEKIFVGIPLYGYDWATRKDGSFDTAKVLEYEDVASIMEVFGARLQFDEKSASPYLEYTVGKKHIVWFENKKSFAAKLELARELGVGGIAFWRLGGENPAVWQTLQILKNQ